MVMLHCNHLVVALVAVDDDQIFEFDGVPLPVWESPIQGPVGLCPQNHQCIEGNSVCQNVCPVLENWVLEYESCLEGKLWAEPVGTKLENVVQEVRENLQNTVHRSDLFCFSLDK